VPAVERPASRSSHAIEWVPILVGSSAFGLNAFVPYHRVIDDAYISYRYAKHLADGHGLVWNPGEAPVEGYTNFLLVLVEAPFLATGVDPLRVAQAYALASVLGIAILLHALGRERGRTGAIGALLFLAVPFVPKHALIGLETLTFSFHLLLACWLLWTAVADADGTDPPRHSHRRMFAASVASFVAGLARPEGFVVCGLMLVIAMLLGVRRAAPRGASNLRRSVLAATAGFGLPALAYHAWRYLYFGDLRPNSYHIKVSAAGGGAWPGLGDFLAFASTPAMALLIVCIVFRRNWTRNDLLLLPAALFPLFYLRSQHIMAFEHRFFVPYVPFLASLAAPTVVRALRPGLHRLGWIGPTLATVVLTGAYVPASPTYQYFVLDKGHRPTRGAETHFMLGRLMATLPDHRDLLVVGPDVGAMAYFSEARWIDPVGLNDNFLARNARAPKQRLVDYLFERRPDVWILAKVGRRFLVGFPGPLGDYSARVSADPRFQAFTHVAAHRKNSGGRYDYHFYVRKDLPRFAEARRILGAGATR
jgi:hypothetical protein